MQAGAGHHLGAFVAANDLVGERRRDWLGRFGCFCFGAYLAIGFSLVFAGTIAGGFVLIARAIHSIEISSPQFRGH